MPTHSIFTKPAQQQPARVYSADDVIKVIYDLSFSQGFYGRLLRDILQLKHEDPAQYAVFCGEMAAQQFTSDLDVVYYFEC